MRKLLKLLVADKYRGDKSMHRQHTTQYEDLCQ